MHLLEDGFQTFLKLTTIFCAGNKRAHIKRQQRFIGKRLWHLTIDDPLCQPFGNCGLANTWLANQHGVVFGTTRQNLHGAANLGLAANHRVQLAIARGIGQIGGEFAQRFMCLFSHVTVCGPALAKLGNGNGKVRRVNTRLTQQLADITLAFRHGNQQRINSQKRVLE